jgi:hypothetical protein
MHDPAVADPQHDDVGEREVADGRRRRTGRVLLDDDDVRIGGDPWLVEQTVAAQGRAFRAWRMRSRVKRSWVRRKVMRAAGKVFISQ